jgi:hypothetical protein
MNDPLMWLVIGLALAYFGLAAKLIWDLRSKRPREGAAHDHAAARLYGRSRQVGSPLVKSRL